jgi:O-antigen ligase
MKQLEQVLRWITLGGVFLMPFIVLIVSESLFFPYITGKNFVFRIIVEVMAGAWLALALVSAAYRPRSSWMLAVLAAFVFIIGLADIFGVNPSKSFWSNFERMEGWITLAHLLMLFVVMVSMLTTEKLWRWFWLTTIGVSVFVGAHALLQVLGGGAGTRVSATLGNATYLAAYMLFHVFLTALVVAQTWVPRRDDDRHLLKAVGAMALWLGTGVIIFSIAALYGGPLANLAPLLVVYALLLAGGVIFTLVNTENAMAQGFLLFVIIMQAMTIFFTGTRGTLLGLVGGVLLTALLLIVLAHRSRIVWRASAGIIGVLLLLPGGFFVVKDQAWVQAIGPLKRMASISLEDNTVKARFMNWNMALKGIQERPLLGWGQANYNYVFNKHYDPQMFGQEPWFDRTHNIIFDWAIAGGILGLFAYLSLFGVALWYLWIPRPGGERVFSISERSILTGLLAAYVFHNMFVFDNITSYLLFIATLGYLTVRATVARQSLPLLARAALPPRALPIAAIVLVLAVWGIAYTVSAPALAANKAILQAIQPRDNVGVTIELFEAALQHKSPIAYQEIREQAVQVAHNIVRDPNIPQEEKRLMLAFAMEQIDIQIAKDPDNARLYVLGGSLLDAAEAHEEARLYMERAHELSPTKQSIMLQLGVTAWNLEDTEVGREYFCKAYELDTSFKGAKVYCAMAMIRIGESNEAQTLVDEIMADGSSPPEDLIRAYASQQQYGKIIELWNKRLEHEPLDVAALFSLALTYNAAGRPGDAIVLLEETAARIPAIQAQADALIQQIRTGQ